MNEGSKPKYMLKSKSIFKAFKSSLSPLVPPGSSAASRSGTTTPAIRSPTPTHDVVFNNLATACRITKDVSEALSKVPYIKAVTGVVAQMIKIHEEVQGNNDRCEEITSMVIKHAYTVIECLADLYTTEGEQRLEGLKAELKSFQSYLEAIILNDLETLKNQSRWKAYAKRDQDAEYMRRIERELKGFIDRFMMKGITASVRAAGATKPILSEVQQTILREHWLRSRHAQYNIAIIDATSAGTDRAMCAPGTREQVLRRVTTWACDRSPDTPAVFWMVGEGGAGKSTIARTIAENFDGDEALPTVVTFFCSRKFSDTNQQVYIIPTIAYQLARLCEFYSSELLKDPKIVDSLEIVSKQMDSLLIQPWEASSSRRSLTAPPFIIIIDALDEIVSQEHGEEIAGGFAFLKSLLKTIDDGHLKGIKFFITSRPNPELSEICQALSSETTCRLYDIPKNEVEDDICRYLQYRLPKLQKSDPELLKSIAAKADGLFIFASTAVLVANPTPGTTLREQYRALKGLVDGLRVGSTTSPVNDLYSQILSDAFEHRNGAALSDRIHLLHTIICTEDRVSEDVLVDLVSSEADDQENAREIVEDLLRRLHAVLWISEGHITWYHTSFLDFFFSSASASITLPGEILDASCDVHLQHATLARRCFHIMRSCLKFNICQLPSSFQLDSEIGDLATRIENNISQALRYACRYWAIHTSKALGHDALEDIERFLDHNLLFWIEVMNLVQQSSLCTPLLNIVQQYVVQNCPGAIDLREHLSAASHFSTVFKGNCASKSTPHLYLSTLVYTASRFPLLQQWRSRFARLPTLSILGIGTQLLMTLNGHTDYVESVALSSDGAQIVSGSYDESIRVWDVGTGEEIHKLVGHTSHVNSVAFSSNGSRVVSGSYDESVRVWNVQTGEEIHKLEGHTGSVLSVAFSPDGARVVSSSTDESIRVWDVETGEETHKLVGHTSLVNSVTFSTDGSRIASASYGKSVRIWDVRTGEEIHKLDGHTASVKSVAFSSDGARVVSGSADKSVRVWDVQTGEEIHKLVGHTDHVYSVAFSSDGARVASASGDRSVRVWDVETEEEIHKLDGHTGSVNSVVFLPNGMRLVSGSNDESVRVWDVETRTEINKLEGHTDWVRSVAFSSEGSRIVSGSDDKSVRIWDIRTGEEIRRLDGHTGFVFSVTFSPDAARVMSGSDDKSVRVWDVKTGETIHQFDGHIDCVRSVVFSPDGSRVVSGSADKSVRVWDVQTGEEIHKLVGHTDHVYSVAFSSDGARVVSASGDRSVRIWDAKTGEKIHKLDGHISSVLSVAFSSDGLRILSGSADNSVRVWDAQTGEKIKRFDGHIDWVRSVAFSLDGTHIVSGSDDKSVRLWDVETGEEIKRFDGHTGYVYSVAFSSNGFHIVSGSSDRSVRVWDVLLANEFQKLNHCTHNPNPTASPSENTLGSGLVASTPSLHQLNWTVDDDGWIVQLPTMNKIMWLPDTLTRYLYRPANSLIISQQTVTLDLEGSAFGTNWDLCYKPS